MSTSAIEWTNTVNPELNKLPAGDEGPTRRAMVKPGILAAVCLWLATTNCIVRREKMHFLRIRSGGQSGVDRAALDYAVRHNLQYVGWCPRGGWAEDFTTPPGLLVRFPHMIETPSAETWQPR